ncbi:DUF5372 family protein [Streptomyces sp. NPDC051217]|uniref:DUF5372 family protein n=1 Tax=Streptomyces sp. NPDC051217 TaxID=3365644 RepID=UPI0037A19F24
MESRFDPLLQDHRYHPSARHGHPRSGRRRRTAASPRQYSGWLVVTHRFHPPAGRRVEVLYSMKHGGGRMFVVDTGSGARTTLPLEWTDRGPAPEDRRVAQESLVELRTLLDALARHCADRSEGGGSS